MGDIALPKWHIVWPTHQTTELTSLPKGRNHLHKNVHNISDDRDINENDSKKRKTNVKEIFLVGIRCSRSFNLFYLNSLAVMFPYHRWLILVKKNYLAKIFCQKHYWYKKIWEKKLVKKILEKRFD